jgi:hypothetical protein
MTFAPKVKSCVAHWENSGVTASESIESSANYEIGSCESSSCDSEIERTFTASPSLATLTRTGSYGLRRHILLSVKSLAASAPLLLRPSLAAVAWFKRQSRGTAHHLALLVGEHAPKTWRVDDLFTLGRRHRAQITDRHSYRALADRRQPFNLTENLPQLLLLFRGHVLHGFHVFQNARLLPRRQTGEMAQALPKRLLLGRRQTPEHRIVL